MSVRAYKITKMECKDKPTFDLWNCHDCLYDIISRNGGMLGLEGGFIELSRNFVEESIEKYKDDPELVEELKTILADFGKEEDHVQYNCF